MAGVNDHLFSVIIPAYNQGKYLAEALDSVLHQTHSDWECIIVNDGSTDDTEDIAQRYVQQDERFIYHKKQNSGLSAARNSGLKLAKGQWIQFLDSDDYITPDKFERTLKVIQDQPDVDIIVSDFKMFVDDPAKATTAFCELKQELLTFNNVLYKWDDVFSIPIHCAVFKHSLFSNVSFVETLKAKEDWVMWIALFIEGPKAVYLNEPLAFYRINPESMTKDHDMVLRATIDAYKHIVNILPENIARIFSNHMTDGLHRMIVFDRQELKVLKNSMAVKLDRKAKNAIHKLITKFKRS